MKLFLLPHRNQYMVNQVFKTTIPNKERILPKPSDYLTLYIRGSRISPIRLSPTESNRTFANGESPQDVLARVQ